MAGVSLAVDVTPEDKALESSKWKLDMDSWTGFNFGSNLKGRSS
jgi:hypothetical protein